MNTIAAATDWFGYKQLEFELEGRTALLLQPYIAASNRPWIWRTEFFGHEPQLDIALLKDGWHIAYLQVSDLYGAPRALEAMRAFQSYLETEFELHGKAVLEGMSRGGLYAFNYAAAFSEKVAALYLDNPVLDIRSWPGGLGSGTGSPECWAQCLEVYGLTEETAPDFVGNPLDAIEQVGGAKIPIIAVCGDADETVPFEENAAIHARRYRELGAPMELIVKPGAGHHPHSLEDPQPLVDFLREHLPASFHRPETLPPRRVVQEDIEWCDVWIPHLNENHLPRVLLIGDSITRAYYGNVEKCLEDKAFVGRLATSRSVGDTALIAEITTVLSQNTFDVIHFNNGMHGWGYSETEYELYFPEFVETIRQCASDARLIWASTTPVRLANNLEEFDSRTRRVKVRNASAAQYVHANGIAVNDLFSLTSIEHFSDDGVHFNEQGSAALAEQVAAMIASTL